ncbi:chemotaxis protein CheA [Syntrophomonas palmitatica]|uniref:chemotaxis protein CheA n=1 Tax=Syntrophomonas palmitatica TaxID=402877 RepID=UPI000B2576EA|nr:chemotaxis protein CheA [Syntrophomonas palmitatica]
MDKLSPEQDLVSEELIDILKRNFQRVKEMLDLKISTIHSLLEEVPPSYADKKLGEILVEEKKVTPDQLNWALNQQKKIGDILVDGGVIKPAELDMVLAKQAVAREKTRETDQTKAPADTGGQSIRVSQEKLDRLMNMIGELLISKNRIFHLANTINITYDMPPLAREVKSVAAELARISDELQNSIMSARMVPLKVLFQRFPRTIRDTARKAGKQVDLIIEGEDTELDKTVIEAINDPLVHMLRNAVDHGLESPADRRAAGKDETGQVRLRAYYQGIHAIIEISDDGRGMNPDEIKYKAVKKGLIKTEQIENMSNEDAYQLIFAPGFSTRDEVSELSGRGVGMDVVKTNVEKIGGSVNMNSRLGQGTTFTLKIPLSMSIIRGLMVETAGQRFVIPLDAIEETVKLPRKAIRKYKHKMVADIREEILPIVDLKDILGLDAAGAFNNHKKLSANDLISIVVLNIDGLKMGLIIDAFQKEQEFVVKALGEDLANLKIYTGASILGDGSVVLILNCAQLL